MLNEDKLNSLVETIEEAISSAKMLGITPFVVIHFDSDKDVEEVSEWVCDNYPDLAFVCTWFGTESPWMETPYGDNGDSGYRFSLN
jgi:hypothetical protein